MQYKLTTPVAKEDLALTDHAALLLDLVPQHHIGRRIGAVDGHAHHSNGRAVVFDSSAVPGAVQPVRKAADDQSTALGQFPANVRRCV